MGKSAKDSVADGYGRTHDVANLFITGGGLFPTIAGVHPTFTLHALTLRTADYMAKNWAGSPRSSFPAQFFVSFTLPRAAFRLLASFPASSFAQKCMKNSRGCSVSM